MLQAICLMPPNRCIGIRLKMWNLIVYILSCIANVDVRFWQCSCHPITMKFSRFIGMAKIYINANSQGRRSNGRVTAVKSFFSKIWRFSDSNSSLDWWMAMEIYTGLLWVCHRFPIVFRGHLPILCDRPQTTSIPVGSLKTFWDVLKTSWRRLHGLQDALGTPSKRIQA